MDPGPPDTIFDEFGSVMWTTSGWNICLLIFRRFTFFENNPLFSWGCSRDAANCKNKGRVVMLLPLLL